MINAADVHIYWLNSVAVSQKYLTTKNGAHIDKFISVALNQNYLMAKKCKLFHGQIGAHIAKSLV
jgi:hypothetical protein